jgi:predicted AlkP superfamily pyrophosphatase or phosphodiesterase
MKRISFIICTLSFFYTVAQTIQRPKLIVGIVVDQMRWDYIYRYHNRFGNDGFKRLLREGFSCENTFIPYVPTVTAAGHACIYTGSVPALNGILGNNWYDRSVARNIYCVEDNEVQTVGSQSAAGKMSPKNLWSTTITDELRLATNFKNKTISISLKDRTAVLPGGHTANAAYWFDNTTGGFISSTFYTKALPAWVNKFNDRKLPDSFLKQNWNTLYPINTYTQSTADAEAFESNLPGEDNSFPHLTHAISNNKYESFRTTPFGNTYTLEMAKTAIEAEELGKGAETDFLTLSLSSTDHIGHTFGPNSVEIEDAYLRLDQDLAAFLNYLDAKTGKGQYLFFLTADHGASHIWSMAKGKKIPAGIITGATIPQLLNESVQKQFNITGIIEYVINNQIFLNESVLAKNNLDRKAVIQFVKITLLKNAAIANVVDFNELQNTALPQQIKMMLTNGYNQKLSGDLQYILKPQWFDAGYTTGATHGTWNPYDAHIPLLWFGWNIKPGKTNREVYMTDIAPTIAALIEVQMPNACIGKAIEEVVK